jgi:hypothetical protein
MPKNKVTDLITDQEIAFARLVLSGTMTDRRAAEAVGLAPDSAAYTKSKPRVRAYMLEHRAAVQQQLVEQDSNEQRRLNLSREQILARLWEVANLSPEMTRGSITGQVKALAMIVAIEGLIPDRRAVPAQNKTAPPPVTSQIYQAAWLGKQQTETIDPQPGTAIAQEEDHPSLAEPEPTPGSAGDAPPPPGPVFDPSVSAFVNRFKPLAMTPSSPHARVPASAPDQRVPSSIENNPSTWRLRL